MLRVRGRKSGQWRTTPVNVLTLGDQRYLVAPRGETRMGAQPPGGAPGRARPWGGDAEPFTAEELGDDDKVDVLRAYLRRWKFEVGRFFDGVSADSPVDELRRDRPRAPRVPDHDSAPSP